MKNKHRPIIAHVVAHDIETYCIKQDSDKSLFAYKYDSFKNLFKEKVIIINDDTFKSLSDEQRKQLVKEVCHLYVIVEDENSSEHDEILASEKYSNVYLFEYAEDAVHFATDIGMKVIGIVGNETMYEETFHLITHAVILPMKIEITEIEQTYNCTVDEPNWKRIHTSSEYKTEFWEIQDV